MIIELREWKLWLGNFFSPKPNLFTFFGECAQLTSRVSHEMGFFVCPCVFVNMWEIRIGQSLIIDWSNNEEPNNLGLFSLFMRPHTPQKHIYCTHSSWSRFQLATMTENVCSFGKKINVAYGKNLLLQNHQASLNNSGMCVRERIYPFWMTYLFYVKFSNLQSHLHDLQANLDKFYANFDDLFEMFFFLTILK